MAVVISVAEKPSLASDPVICLTSENEEFDRFFSKELWPKVGRSECVKCHKIGGDADDTRLRPSRPESAAPRRTPCGSA